MSTPQIPIYLFNYKYSGGAEISINKSIKMIFLNS